MPLLFVSMVVALQSGASTVEPAERWHARVDAMLRPAVYDAEGRPLGFLPPEGATELNALYAADPGRVPDACIDLALQREDMHYLSRWRHVRGVDWLGFLRALATGRGGASTLPMQLARQLHPEWNRLSRPERKLREIAAAGMVVDMHAGDYRALARTYLAVAPFGRAYGDVRGLAALADLLWGIQVEAMTPDQCALAIALLPVRIDFAKADSPDTQALWSQRLNQARRLLEASPDPLHRDALPGLARWTKLTLRPSFAQAGPASTFNLGSRTRLFVLPHLSRIHGDDPGPESPGAQAARQAEQEGQP